MKKQLLAQIDFDKIIEKGFPGYAQGRINVTKSDLNIGEIISALLPFIFTLAGLALLFYLVWGGFELLTSTGDPKRIDEGKNKIANAIIGFIIIFVSYWIMRILETVLGIEVLG